jgi:hypothetical protein
LSNKTWIAKNKLKNYKKSILKATDTQTIPKGNPSPQSLATVNKNSLEKLSSPVYNDVYPN